MYSLDNVLSRVHRSASLLGLEDNMVALLCSFKNEWAGDMPVKIGGKLRIVRTVRVWHRSPHNDKPMKGGDRFHPAVDLAAMKGHAIEMSFKHWLMQLPFGGAKGGVAINPLDCSQEELKAVTEKLVDERDERGIIGPYLDVPAPDVGTNAQIMNWIRQRFAQRRRAKESAQFAGVVTGKPVGYGRDGIPGRETATGYGLIEILEEVLNLQNICKRALLSTRAAVMGFGNVGSHAARFLAQRGCRVVAVSDVDGGAYRANGFDYAELMNVKTPRELNAERITNDELLELKDVHLLLPAALENVFTEKNASRINAKFILEGANGPTTPEADAILEERGILVIPDILANAGGVTVSFFEWARNVGYTQDPRVPFGTNDEQDILRAMSAILRKAAGEVFRLSQQHKISLRLAAYMVGIQRVVPLLSDKYLV